jgi:hypothetical protein
MNENEKKKAIRRWKKNKLKIPKIIKRIVKSWRKKGKNN